MCYMCLFFCRKGNETGADRRYGTRKFLPALLSMRSTFPLHRFALSDFYSSGPCSSSNRGVLSALQTGVRVGSSPTPAALLQASRAGTRTVGSANAGTAAAAAIAASGAATRESLQSAVTRGHLEESLGNAVLLGSAKEFFDILKAYAGHLAKTAGFGDGRFVGHRPSLRGAYGCWRPLLTRR